MLVMILFLDRVFRLILWVGQYQSNLAPTNSRQRNVAPSTDAIVNSTHPNRAPAHTRIDGGSQVLNGNVTKEGESQSSRRHILAGGSIRDGSKFVNGDMSPESFLAFFCKDN